MQDRGATSAFRLGRRFGNLKIRPKLMVLHNVFFFVLACAVYFSLIPQFQARVADAEARETSLITQMFSEGKPLLRLPRMEIYQYREGAADALGIPADAASWLDAHPGAIWRDPAQPDYLYRKEPSTGHYRSLRMPHAFYSQAVARARWALLIVLGLIYVFSVLVLELAILPAYVYRPLRMLLEADSATQRGDAAAELISERAIPGDEIGQLMRSRNATVAELRKHERDLAEALARLEEVNDDLKRKNYLLETARRNLADQDRLVSLGMLSASVAHELNTPLAVLHGSIEKLGETVEDQAAQERLARMRRVTERLRRISEGLLDFARVRRQDMTPVPVRTVIEEAWNLVAIDEKAAAVHFSNDTRPGDIVTGNPDRLVQVFVNLLRNALGAVKSSGIIQVKSHLVPGDSQSWVGITIEDNGPGIPADVLPHIFEAFVSSRLDARGTGLGLTVAEGIVHQHGGSIEASTRPGGGACLEVRLPAAAAVPARASEVKA